MGIRLNEDKELVNKIDEMLNDNLNQYGERYCPCKLIHNDDSVCMCKEFREQENGECHCGKFIKD